MAYWRDKEAVIFTKGEVRRLTWLGFAIGMSSGFLLFFQVGRLSAIHNWF